MDKVLYDYAMSFVGKPYRWGGDDPMASFDCSGLVVEILQSSGDFPHGKDATAQGLYSWFVMRGKITLQAPCFGALAFFGKDINRISHVGFCLDAIRMLEAGGGNSKIDTVEEAIDANAYIRIRPVSIRKDLVSLLKVVV